MTTIAVIPARYASTRFPGKPLAADTGKFLIQHVCERVSTCSRIDRVIVATDDERIVDAVRSFGGEVHMTRSDHPTGTDRVAQVAESIGAVGDEVILNVQGDEPEIGSDALDPLLSLLESPGNSIRIATLAAPFSDDGPREGPGSPLDPHCVKVVLNAQGNALYFSRSAIPYPRSSGGVVEKPSLWLLHLGVYAFRGDTLQSITGGRMSQGGLEQTESLEQLRWLEHGFSIGVVTIGQSFVGIDTREDYAAFVERTKT